MHEGALANKTIAITGANTGIGRATAEGLAARGARLILLGRSEERTRPVLDTITSAHGEGRAHFVEVDLGLLASVERAAQEVLQRFPELDILINNAGLAGSRGLTQDGFERTVGTNHLGPFLLTLRLLPVLRTRPDGRIVNVSSNAAKRAKGIDWGSITRPTQSLSGFAEYAVSKLCNVLFTQELARREPGIQTFSLHHGAVASDIWREVPWPLGAVAKLFMKTNEEGARTSLYCATAEGLASHSGAYFENERPARLPRRATDLELARELWERSVAWTASPAAS